jgi:hypothetical protein
VHYRNGLVRKSGEKLQLAASTIWFLGLGSGFLLVMVVISDQSWLYLCIFLGWLLVCFWNNSLSRLRCLGVASAYGWVTILLYCLWLKKHIHYFLTISPRACHMSCYGWGCHMSGGGRLEFH